MSPSFLSRMGLTETRPSFYELRRLRQARECEMAAPPRAVLAAGHTFGDSLLCECGVHWEDHQRSPHVCSVVRRTRADYPQREGLPECRNGHAKNAENGLYKPKHGRLAWYCRTCARASKAARQLKA